MRKWICCGVALVAATAAAAVSPLERESLIALYNSTGGTSWTRSTGWLGAAGTECQWQGISCDEAGSTVVAIELNVNRLSGTLPREVGNFVNLERLSLFFNEIGGTIPDELFRLSKLQHLDLSFNQFRGPFPARVTDLHDLEVLWLSWNQLEGVIPQNIGALTALRTFAVGNNRLTGIPPPSLGALTKLTWLDLGRNDFSGPFPQFISSMTALEVLWLDANHFEGSIPPFVWTFTNLESLGLGSNRFTGSISPEIGNLEKLESLSLQINGFSGPLPSTIGRLRNLESLRTAFNQFGGFLPPEIWQLDKLTTLSMFKNSFEGEIPAEVDRLALLEELDLGANRITGVIPPQIGNLAKLEKLDLSYNALRGRVPSEITKLTSLFNIFGLKLQNNALFTGDPAVRQFILAKNGTLFDQQVSAPANFRLVSTTDRSALLQWDRVTYWFAEGAYQLTARDERGNVVSIATTDTLNTNRGVVHNLAPDTRYTFTIAAIFFPDFWQQNVIASEISAPVPGTTGVRVLSPPVVEMTERPRGLVQVAGTPANEDRFVLRNLGDRATNIRFDLHADFVTLEPATFSLAPGASQVVTVRSLSRPPDIYYGYAVAEGEGASNFIWLTLLSIPRVEGVVRAEPVDLRVDFAGVPGSDSVGQVRFRNTGTSTLEGMLVSDQPWLVPDLARITIPPGFTGDARFRIQRSKRPANAAGTLVANLSLIYVSSGGSAAHPSIFGNTPNISISKVTVVDVSKPSVTSSTIPPSSGNVVYFFPGVASFVSGGTSFVSDLSLLNRAGDPIGDLRLYYTPAGTQQTSVATLGALPASESLTLTNLVTSVYGAESQVGSLQVRTGSWEGLLANARLLGVSANGSVSGEVPVLRSDRSVPPGGRMLLTGVRKSPGIRTDIYVQETGGAAASARIECLDAAGTVVATRDASLAPFAMAEVRDAVPANCVTAVVSDRDSLGRIDGYARVIDEVTGDHRSILDASLQQEFELGETMRVPIVEGSAVTAPAGPRRRVVGHAVVGSTTELSLHNPTTAEVIAAVRVIDANGQSTETQVVLAPRNTVTLSHVGAGVTTPTAQVLVVPYRNDPLIASAYTKSSSGSAGATVPILAGPRGLRLGQWQTFSQLDDSTRATITSHAPATYRTALGLVETGEGSVTVRARVFLDEGRSLATSAIYRDLQLSKGQQVILEELVRAIVGDARESLGELHNLQLRVEVIAGSGAVVPFVVVTDNGSGDVTIRLQ